MPDLSVESGALTLERRRHLWHSQPMPKRILLPTKECLHCGRFFGRRKKASDAQWSAARFCGHPCARRHFLGDPENRFWSDVDKAPGLGPKGDCWLWRGRLEPSGYARVQYLGKPEYVHRAAYKIAVWPIPDGLMVCHTCDVRHCVRPEHWFLGTQKDNIQDAVRKGRHAHGERGNAKLTEADVRSIRESHEPTRILSARYCVAKQTIRAIRRGDSWMHVAANTEMLTPRCSS